MTKNLWWHIDGISIDGISRLDSPGAPLGFANCDATDKRASLTYLAYLSTSLIIVLVSNKCRVTVIELGSIADWE
jgi:hypothetical protein